jgi:phospholipase/carboxylesterase
MPAERQQLGGLECVVFPPSGDVAPKVCVVLCHGFGAPATDLVPLAFELFDTAEHLSEEVHFVFPAAPLSLDEQGLYGGRAWWPLDINALMNAIARGEVRILRDALPPELPVARARLAALVTDVQQQTGLPINRFVLGGFSQGAMVATDLTLRLDESPAALAIFSGTLLCEAEWRSLAPARRGMPVLQSHGRYDSMLPFIAAEWLRDLLREAGLEVEFIDFAGDHTIAPQALRRFAELLTRLVETPTM